ncbi:MAG: hypothetical protein AB8B69_02725 [Chitinophagales bacterium]
MKQIYAIILFLFSSIFLFISCSLTPDEIEGDSRTAFFVKLYGGVEDQKGFDLLQKPDGGYLIVGTTNSFKDSVCIDSESEYCAEDADNWDIEDEWGAYVIDTDEGGNEKWSALYEATNSLLRGSRVLITKEGNYLILVDFKNEIALVELDSQGKTVKQKVIITEAELEWNPFGSIYDYRFKGNIQFAEDGESILIVGGYSDVLNVLKLNSDFEEEWSKNDFSSTGLDTGIDIYPTNDNEYVILFVKNDDKLNFIKVDANANSIFEASYGNALDIYENDYDPRMVPSTNGGFAIVTSTPEKKLRLIQINTAFDVINDKILQVEITDCESSVDLISRDIKPLSDGYIILANSTCLNKQYFTLIKTDLQGTVLFTKKYGNGDNNDASRVIQTSDGGFAILGTTDFSVNTMIALIKTNPEGELVSLN